MAKTNQSLYCDESGIHSSKEFHFGALVCSPRRAEILNDQINNFRVQYGCTREMKWTKVSKKMLPAYKAFVDIFFTDPFSYFRVLNVLKSGQWKRWASDEEKRFYKSYYFFLRGLMSPFYRYEIYLDHKSGKPYRWETLLFSINASGKRDYGLRQKQIYSLNPVSSKSNNLLQLVDVILGASRSNAISKPKRKLIEYVQQKAKEQTQSDKVKIKCEEWSPYQEVKSVAI